MTTGAHTGTLTGDWVGPCAGDGDAAAVLIASSARFGIQWPVSCGRPMCRGQAICVLDRVRCERPDGRRDNSSAPDYGAMPRGLDSSLADHRREGKKIFCCVTTRAGNFGGVNDLGHGLGSVTALFLCLGMARSSRGVLAMRGLAPRRLPTTDFPLTVRVATVTLVPTRRQILTITPLAQAGPRPRSTRSRRAPASYFNVRGAHGSCNSQGKARGECTTFSSGAYQHAHAALTRRSSIFPGTRQRSKRLQICASNQTTGRCRSPDRNCCRFCDRPQLA